MHAYKMASEVHGRPTNTTMHGGSPEGQAQGASAVTAPFDFALRGSRGRVGSFILADPLPAHRQWGITSLDPHNMGRFHISVGRSSGKPSARRIGVAQLTRLATPHQPTPHPMKPSNIPLDAAGIPDRCPA